MYLFMQEANWGGNTPLRDLHTNHVYVYVYMSICIILPLLTQSHTLFFAFIGAYTQDLWMNATNSMLQVPGDT